MPNTRSASITLNTDLNATVSRIIAAGKGPMELAQRIADQAKSLAPVDTGAYRDGIIVEKTGAGARVVATDQKSHWVEFGRPNHNVEGQFVLRQAVDALGLVWVKGKS